MELQSPVREWHCGLHILVLILLMEVLINISHFAFNSVTILLAYQLQAPHPVTDA
jgi:hypothetical protein